MKNYILSVMRSPMSMMIVCCIAMVGGYLVIAGSDSSASALGLLLPLAACLGMHFVMHKFMGHGHRQDEDNNSGQRQKHLPAPARVNQSSHRNAPHQGG